MTKFVVVGDQPHALHEIAFILNAIPQVKVYGELFSRRDSMQMELYDQANVLIKINQDPIDFLTTQVYTTETTTGFLLPYNQARCAAWSQVWGFLKQNVKILHVSQNPIQSIIAQSKSHQVCVDLTRAIDQIREFENIQKDISMYFGFSDILSVSTSTLQDQWLQILEFLNISDHTSLPKKIDVNVRDKVENYSDLVNSLKDTPYYEYIKINESIRSLYH